MASLEQILEKQFVVAFQAAPELNDFFPEGLQGVIECARLSLQLALGEKERFSTIDMSRVLYSKTP